MLNQKSGPTNHFRPKEWSDQKTSIGSVLVLRGSCTKGLRKVENRFKSARFEDGNLKLQKKNVDLDFLSVPVDISSACRLVQAF